MYKCVPKRLKRSVIWSFASVFCGAVIFGTSYFINSYKSVVQLIAMAFFAFGIWVACRYSLVGYYYVIDGENFRIVKVSGKREQVMCNISMRTGHFVKKTSEDKKRKNVRIRYNYCRNFATPDEYFYSFEWNGSEAEIIFEPNAEFAAAMNDKIEELKNAPPEENAETNGWYDE